jgi:hypothetical protein
MCVTGAGAGVDSAWEQEKPEARKMLENAAESPASSARGVGQFLGCKTTYCLKADTTNNQMKLLSIIKIIV